MIYKKFLKNKNKNFGNYGIEQELKIIKKMNKPVASIIFNNNKIGLKEIK